MMAVFQRRQVMEDSALQGTEGRQTTSPRTMWKFVIGDRAFAGRGAVMAVVSLTCFVVIWQLTSDYIISPFLIPPPTAVVRAAIPMMRSGEYFQDVGISLLRIFIGFATGTAAAVFIGLLLGRLRALRQFFDPIIEVMRYLSPTAMIPIAVIWFGIGETSKYFLIFWGTFFILVISTIDGVLRVPVTRVRAAQCLGASSVQIFTWVIIPTILPVIITGMRLAMASSFMSIIPAEMLAAEFGHWLPAASRRCFGANRSDFCRAHHHQSTRRHRR